MAGVVLSVDAAQEEGSQGPQIVGLSEIMPEDTVIELRGMIEASVPAVPQALRILPDALDGFAPQGEGRIVLACASGLRAWHGRAGWRSAGPIRWRLWRWRMKAPMKMGPKILLVGGMDSSGGAGLMRDAAAVADLGGIARCAVTAVTAQTDKGVRWAMPVPSEGLRAQISAAFEDRVDAIKIGMLGNGMSAEAVAAALPPEGAVPLVLDPVLRASSGRALLDPAGLAAMIAHLFPRTDVLTPNLPELAALGAALG